MADTVSVLVVSYRPGHWLTECLASVASHEVVLVDNGSPGAEASVIGRRFGARVLRSETNLGFTGGVNLGAQHVRSDFVALLNDDAVAEGGWPTSGLEVFGDPSVAIAGPKVVLTGTWAEVDWGTEGRHIGADARWLGRQLHDVAVAGEDVLAELLGGVHDLERDEDGRLFRWTNGLDPVQVPLHGHRPEDVEINGVPAPLVRTVRLINSAGTYLSARGHGGDYGWGAPDGPRFDVPAERFGVTGAAMLLRGEVLDRLGGLSPRFFAYYEDLDLCWRARLAGMRAVYDPGAIVQHRRSATATLDAGRLDGLAWRNRLVCLVRNAPTRVAVEEVRAALAEHDRPLTGRQVAGPLARAALDRIGTLRPSHEVAHQVFATWAGRDNFWGMPSDPPGGAA